MTYYTGEKDARALMVRCSNSHCEDDDIFKCEWTGELGDLKDHHLKCPLEPLPCPNKCIENGKEVKIARKYLEKHMEDECLNRSYVCPHCNEKGTYLERTTTHFETCKKVDVPCPNKPCSVVVLREELENHLSSECLHTAIPCSHFEVGCLDRLQRQDLKEHETDMTLHMDKAKATIAAQRDTIRELKESMKKLEFKMKREIAATSEKSYLMRNGQITFKMIRFSEYASTSKEFKSRPFYTGHRGYKMCVIVEANGASKGKGTYLSIYAHLMKGENDDRLRWPLVGTVTFELLNQVADHGHRKSSCIFPSDDKDNHRVIGHEIADAGYGCPKFISHAKLGVGSVHEVSKDVQYLKDDTLYLRVAVEAPDPVDHNWLKCY